MDDMNADEEVIFPRPRDSSANLVHLSCCKLVGGGVLRTLWDKDAFYPHRYNINFYSNFKSKFGEFLVN